MAHKGSLSSSGPLPRRPLDPFLGRAICIIPLPHRLHHPVPFTTRTHPPIQGAESRPELLSPYSSPARSPLCPKHDSPVQGQAPWHRLPHSSAHRKRRQGHPRLAHQVTPTLILVTKPASRPSPHKTGLFSSLRHPRDTCDTLPLGMVPHAIPSIPTTSKPCGGVTPDPDINIARGSF
jgi:hypothetical protein